MRITYTADNETPSCVRCDNFGCAFKCEKYCGAEHGWYGYVRTVEQEEYEVVYEE